MPGVSGLAWVELPRRKGVVLRVSLARFLSGPLMAPYCSPTCKNKLCFLVVQNCLFWPSLASLRLSTYRKKSLEKCGFGFLCANLADPCNMWLFASFEMLRGKIDACGNVNPLFHAKKRPCLLSDVTSMAHMCMLLLSSVQAWNVKAGFSNNLGIPPQTKNTSFLFRDKATLV
jgi:hypothetical protein